MFTLSLKLRGPAAHRSLVRFCGIEVNTHSEVIDILDAVLGLAGRSETLLRESPLLGAVPELDSVAVVSLITTLEERFGFSVSEDEFDRSRLETVGALTDFALSKVRA